MWRTIRIKDESYRIVKKIAEEHGKSMCEVASTIISRFAEEMGSGVSEVLGGGIGGEKYKMGEEVYIVLENRTGRMLKASVIVEAEYPSENLIIGEERTFQYSEPKTVRYRIILEEAE